MTFNLGTFLFEAINFVVLAYILHRLLYRPLRQAIDERCQANEKAHAEAQKTRQDALALQGQVQAQLTDMEQQRQKTLHEAREQATAERQKTLADAERTLQRRQDQVHQELAREREEMLRTARTELVAVAIDLAERLLREACDSTLNQQLARRLAATLAQLSDSECQQLRDNWQLDGGAVVESAADMDSASVQAITAAVEAVVNRQVTLAIHTRPDLLGGLRLRMAGQVWDASMAGQLQEARTPELEAAGHV